MKSRVVGIIKFDAQRTDGREGNLGLDLVSGEEGLALENWLSALVGEVADDSPWNRVGFAGSPRRVRANLAQLAQELDREYLELAAM